MILLLVLIALVAAITVKAAVVPDESYANTTALEPENGRCDRSEIETYL